MIDPSCTCSKITFKRSPDISVGIEHFCLHLKCGNRFLFGRHFNCPYNSLDQEFQTICIKWIRFAYMNIGDRTSCTGQVSWGWKYVVLKINWLSSFILWIQAQNSEDMWLYHHMFFVSFYETKFCHHRFFSFWNEKNGFYVHFFRSFVNLLFDMILN